MGRLSALLLVFALAATAALGLSACGEESADLLPGDTASEISSNLDQVRELVGAGECIGAADAAEEVTAQIDALGGVDKRLKAALREGATRLNEVVAGCEEAPEEETEPAVETAVEADAEEEKEKPQKPDKSKPKPEQEAEEAPEGEEAETGLPPQAEGKAKGQEEPEEAEAPPATDGGTPAGGIAPSEEAGGG